LERYIDYNDNYNKSYDLIITDIEMPSVNGIELSKNILKLNKNQKIIVLSAHEESHYLIDLLNIGVKGFLKKPFNKKRVLEVLHGICNELDIELKNKTEVKLNNGFIWHCDSKVLTHEGISINLCASETALLDLLISNRNITFSIDDIFNVVYDDYFEKDLSIDSVKSLLKRIRKKVPSDLIKNIYGEGYRINQQLFTA
jgi:DNA-binding response OmpR family regulator